MNGTSALPAALLRELVIANRILARENVVDAYGHVSMRHPEDPNRFLMAASIAPEMVEEDDIIEFNLDCTPAHADEPPALSRALHSWRHLRGAARRAGRRPRPFGGRAAVFDRHDAAAPGDPFGQLHGRHVPVWDIADRFGPTTNMLVTGMEQARDLARCLGDNNVA